MNAKNDKLDRFLKAFERGRIKGGKTIGDRAVRHQRMMIERANEIRAEKPYLTHDKRVMEVMAWCEMESIDLRPSYKLDKNGKKRFYTFRTVSGVLKKARL